jgi:methyl coenzyme M reductase subunit D
MAKITQEEQDFIKKLQEKYSELTVKIGQVNMEMHDLENTLNELKALEKDLLDQYIQSREDERTFINSLSDKYGEGSLNLETGEFIPNS